MPRGRPTYQIVGAERSRTPDPRSNSSRGFARPPRLRFDSAPNPASGQFDLNAVRDLRQQGIDSHQIEQAERELLKSGGRRSCLLPACAALLFLALVFVGVSVWAPLFIRKQLREGIKEGIKLSTRSSPGYRLWHDNSDSPTPVRFFMWNMTNAARVANDSTVAPAFEEVGPYVYNQTSTRFNISWSDDRTRLKYRTFSRFKFDPEASCSGCTEADMITTVDLVVYGLVMSLPDPSALESLLTAFRGNNSEPSAQEAFLAPRAVRDILLGYDDPLYSFFARGRPFKGAIPVQETLAEAVEETFEEEIYTGVGDVSRVREFIRYNNVSSARVCVEQLCTVRTDESTVPAWGTPEASRIRGTDGGQFWDVQRGGTVWVWQGSNSRSVPYTNQDREIVSHHGIDLYRFTESAAVYDSVREDPAMAAWYQYGPRGVWNQSFVNGGPPLFLSKPHFMDADPGYAASIVGMEPNRDAHLTHFDVEPLTGASLSVNVRIQVNAVLQPIAIYDGWFQGRNSTVLPMFWVDTGGGIRKPEAAEFRAAVYGALWLAELSRYGGVAMALFCFLLALGLFHRHWKHLRHEDVRRAVIQHSLAYKASIGSIHDPDAIQKVTFSPPPRLRAGERPLSPFSPLIKVDSLRSSRRPGGFAKNRPGPASPFT